MGLEVISKCFHTFERWCDDECRQSLRCPVAFAYGVSQHTSLLGKSPFTRRHLQGEIHLADKKEDKLNPVGEWAVCELRGEVYRGS